MRRRTGSAWGKVAGTVLTAIFTMVLVWWNARDINNKEPLFKDFLKEEGAIFAGVSEPMTYKQEQELSDARWNWTAGRECGPTEKGGKPHGGRGAFTDKTKTKASVVRSGHYNIWHRIELDKGHMIAGTGYWPKAQDTIGHRQANDELTADLEYFDSIGSLVVFGGDLNCHIGANGDLTPIDKAGEMLKDTAERGGLLIVNTMGDLCTGGPTRVQVRIDETQESTVDYVLCSRPLCPYIKSLRIDERQMESDHRPLVLTLEGVPPEHPRKEMAREVWNVRDIPKVEPGPWSRGKKGDWSWIDTCRAKFVTWISETNDLMRATRAAGIESSRVGDVLDWSFQLALDQLAAEQLGSRIVGPQQPLSVDSLMRMCIDQRDMCENIMKRVMKDMSAPEQAKIEARRNFLHASKQVRDSVAKKKALDRLRIFRDVEAHQADSKLFWGKFKQVRGSIATNKSPPPVAITANGTTVTDPVQVLKAWRDFCCAIGSSDLTDTEEEGIYDDEYRDAVEARLAWLRSIKIHQPELDGPFTSHEVFDALRRLRMGKAPGEDGILTDILKSAGDAVNNSRLQGRGTNTVVDAIVLLFNYMFDNEIWPARWGSGVVCPLHKHDSRLDPSNYRPITLTSVLGKLFGFIVSKRLSDFTEATDSVSDEQGGFRPNRGTPDQVFIFREILALRKERGQTTYASYLDVRKAYDTVWREQAYTRVHDAGIRGKLWRQLMAMHANISRSVRHPLGMTDPYGVDRGVAQGAVESPWLYSIFIDGLTQALKQAGCGIMVAGVRVPCLMYADDIVMLADSQPELAIMHEVVSEYARKNRFQFNGSKSGVMVFGASAAARARAEGTNWTLSGSPVKVVDSYTYLGTITQAGGLGWTAHLRAAIGKAKRRSADLLWVCRADRGMRPRTAITLWQSMVRPLLEYASELWSGQVPDYLVVEAERVQMSFLRSVLGLHGNGSGVADDVVRAETGCERIQDRWLKLKLGYWRRLFAAKPGRLLRVVAEFRHQECVGSEGTGRGSKGWMPTALRALNKCGLGGYWEDTGLAASEASCIWKEKVYEAVNECSNRDREARMSTLTSTADYVNLKEWGVNTEEYSAFTGEVDRLCQHVPERYLDDRVNLKGTRLKMLCRTGALPVMRRIGRELDPAWPPESRVCFACNKGVVEDIHHFLMDCPAYHSKRTILLERVAAVYADSSNNCMDPTAGSDPPSTFIRKSSKDQALILLGKRFGDPVAEDSVDRLVKRYLAKSWNIRSPVTAAINATFGKSYEVYVAAVR